MTLGKIKYHRIRGWSFGVLTHSHLAKESGLKRVFHWTSLNGLDLSIFLTVVDFSVEDLLFLDLTPLGLLQIFPDGLETPILMAWTYPNLTVESQMPS